MKISKQSFGQVVLEFVSVVFAVLLALGLDSYKEKRERIRESEVLKDRILQECTLNLAKLDTVIAENQAFKNYLDSLSQLKEISALSASFSSELLLSSAWKSAESSPAFHYLASDFLIEAAEVYDQQDYYMNISNQMFSNLGSMMVELRQRDPRDMVGLLNYYLSNMLDISQDLRERYKEFIRHHQDA